MNYDKIKSLASTKKFSLRELAAHIKFSEAGFHQMMKNKSMQVDTLENIAKFFDVPVTYFFSDSDKISDDYDFELLKKENEFLKGVIEVKDKIITELQQKIKAR